MRALVLKSSEHIEVMDIPKPAARPGQVLVRVLKCGICGSDVRYVQGDNPWAKQTLGRAVPNPPNMVLGHEFLGIVEAVAAPEDEGLLGKRVAVNTFLTCGTCEFCRAGQENLCPNTLHIGHGQGWGTMEFYPGGMAEYCPAFRTQVYELPDHVTDDQATFLDPLIVAVHAVDVARLKVLYKVAVQGGGPIGLLIAQVARLHGAATIILTDVAKENVAAARAVGVDVALQVADGSDALRAAVRDHTQGEGVDVVFNTVGTSASIAESMELLRKGGTAVLMATKDDTISFPATLLSGERTLKTSSNAMYTDFPRALSMLAQGMVNVDALISHRFPLTQAVAAFGVACTKSESGAIKVVLDCQA